MKKKTLYMSRIIRVFEAEEGALSTNEIYDMLLSQSHIMVDPIVKVPVK